MKTIAVLLALCCALPAIAQKEIVTVSDWRVHDGDNPAWAAPAFDDSQWAEATYSELRYYLSPLGTGTHWYRSTFPVPADFQGQELAVGLGPLDEVYDVYIDGALIGRFGSWQPVPHAIFPRHQVFLIPPGLMKGPIAHIAIRRWRGAAGLAWQFFSSGNSLFPHPPQIGSKPAIEALERLHFAAGAIRESSWYLTYVLFLFAAAISFVLFSVQRRRLEYLYLGFSCVFDGLTPLIGSLLGTSDSVMARSWGPVLVMFFGFLPVAFSMLFLAALCARFRRILQIGAVFAVIVGLAAAYMLGAQSYGAVLFVSFGGGYGFAVFDLFAMWGLFQDRSPGSFAIAASLLLQTASVGWDAMAVEFHLPRLIYTAGPFVIDSRSVAGIVFIFVTLLVLYLRYRDEQDRQAAMDQDLAAARRMQEQLLAGSAENPAGFAVDAVYRPAREVGGDFYRMQSLEDGSLLVMVGDVSGKGLDAAMLVAVILGSLANETHRSPASLLGYLNRAVAGRTGGGFITACCARFYPDGRVVLANAGHISPYLDGRELQLENGLPLGISLDARYSETEIETRGTITFVSDGVVEARDGKGELLGFERMAALTRKPAAEIAQAAERWGQEDDITVLCVRCTAGLQPATGYEALQVALPMPESA
jgi:hypothetical protein